MRRIAHVVVLVLGLVFMLLCCLGIVHLAQLYGKTVAAAPKDAAPIRAFLPLVRNVEPEGSGSSQVRYIFPFTIIIVVDRCGDGERVESEDSGSSTTFPFHTDAKILI